MSRAQEDAGALSRRAFLKGAGGAAAAGSALGAVRAFAAQEPVERMAGATEIELSINGAKQKVIVEPRTTLLNALRNHCQPPLTGAKLVCDMGSCGACTVFMDKQPVYACMLRRFPALELILDVGAGGTTPSTIIDLSGPAPVVLREGAGPVELGE